MCVYRSDVERFIVRYAAELSAEDMASIWGQTIKQWLKAIVTQSLTIESLTEEIPNGSFS